MKHGATRAVGVDKSDCILAARELAKEEGVDAEFWQVDIDSKEFRRHCPPFDVVFLFSVITHIRDKEDFLDWLDGIVLRRLVFESNHGERNKQHIELVRKHLWFQDCKYLGSSDIPEKPHYMWELDRHPMLKKYPQIKDIPVQWIPIDMIAVNESTVMDQDNAYSIHTEEFKLLVEDIKKRGIREPLVVKRGKGKYAKFEELRPFQGAHRYMAAKQLGYRDLPCRVL